MNPSPEQIKQWREKFEAQLLPATEMTRDVMGNYYLNGLERVWQGYLRDRTEQAAEIAALKAQIAELMPLAKFCATLINDGYFEADDALYAGLMDGDYKFKPEIKSTIDKLLKD